MGKIVLRLLAGLASVYFGFITHMIFIEPMGKGFDTMVLMIGSPLLCFILLYYSITGNRRPFFPSGSRYFPRKNAK